MAFATRKILALIKVRRTGISAKEKKTGLPRSIFFLVT
jgi:hypothetical protein